MNQIGEARCEAVAAIEGPSTSKPQVEKTADEKATLVQPLVNITAHEGQPAVFSCQISGKPSIILSSIFSDIRKLTKLFDFSSYCQLDKRQQAFETKQVF